MNETTRNAPRHFWIVSVLSLLWKRDGRVRLLGHQLRVDCT